MPTLYDLRQTATMNGEKLKSKQEELNRLVSNPNSRDEDITRVESEITSIEKRFEISKRQLDEKEEEMKSSEMKEAEKSRGFNVLSDAEKLVKAKAEFYRYAIRPQEFEKPSEEAQRVLLHAIPNGNGTGGEHLLPTNMSKEVIHEPFATNPLRDVVSLTNIKGLEIPRISYTLENDDFIDDTEVAKELELKGDSVKFGRNKYKVISKISDTVLHGSDVDLVNYVEKALYSGAAAKERKLSFATTPKTGEEHMSFYEADKIKEVSGADIYSGVIAALADLHEDFRANAKIIMSYADYTKVVTTLANGNAAFFTAPPETIWGKQVIFMDSATKPVVGDLNYFGINYDSTTFDTAKDVDQGVYKFVLTVWFDQVRYLDSAFRVVKVTPTVPAG